MADWIIPTVLIILYLITSFHQRNVIRSKNETIKDLTTRNQELERVSNTSLGVASERAKDMGILKEMYSPDFLKQYLEMQITVEVNKVKSSADQQAAEDKRMIASLNEHLNEGISYIAYMLHVERKYTREQRIAFFHTFFDKGKNLYWYITNQKIESIESRINPNQSENSDVPNTLDGIKG